MVTQIKQATTGIPVGPAGQLIQRIIHAPHDEVAGQQIGDRQTERRGRKEVPIVRMDVMAVALPDAEPTAIMGSAGEKDNDGFVIQIGATANLADAIEDRLSGKGTFSITGAADHFSHRIHGNDGPFREPQAPEGTIGPLQQCGERVRIDIGRPVEVDLQISGGDGVLGCS